MRRRSCHQCAGVFADVAIAIVANIVEVVTRRAVAIFVNVIVRGVVIVVVLIVVGLQPHTNPAPAKQASRAF